LIDPLVDATIQLHKRLLGELLPTPAKPHYVFNLRDISKVFQGIVGARKSIAQPRQLVRLWHHECTRVFRDRLVDGVDVRWFEEVLRKYASVQPRLVADLSFYEPPLERGLLFAEAFQSSSGTMQYTEVTDRAAYIKQVADFLDSYNGLVAAPMDLVLFWDAVEHLAHIQRTLRQPGGHALLLGMGGSGRQCLTRLAAHMCKQQVVELDFSKSYGITEWHDDVKHVMFSAGLQGKETVFLFSD
jgi:dynein heavy chain